MSNEKLSRLAELEEKNAYLSDCCKGLTARVDELEFELEFKGQSYGYKQMNAKRFELEKNLQWLVKHSIETASISKARGAELLGIPLIDMDDFLKQAKV